MKSLKKTCYMILLFSVGMSTQGAFAQCYMIRKVQNLAAVDKPVYYNLEKGTALAAPDTVKANWDISFQRTKIELQEAASGQLLESSDFAKIERAPSAGYISGKDAIPNGSGKGWYLYNMDNHTITPMAGKVVLIHSASGKYYKLVIDSYYKDGQDGPSGYYTFRYTEIPAGN